jgi:hypothetical protein
MGRTIREELKNEYLRFRVPDSFKINIIELKEKTPGCKNMDLQQFILRLIELGMEEENRINGKIKGGDEEKIKSTSEAV